jgi:hypothetical protein
MKDTLILLALGLLVCLAQAEESDVPGGYDNKVEDPCAEKHCDVGFECDLDENDNPICICIRKCPVADSEINVCSTQNVTFDSECEFHQIKCFCSHKSHECPDRGYRKGYLDYYGPCKELKPCKDEEMEDFPHRMREWLFYVMEELDNRNDLTSGAHKMVEEAKNQEHRWVLPVIWKFCELDTTKDRLVNKDELLPITAPLKPLEHCTGPFLQRCDENADGTITLEEWGNCLGLDREEIEDRCEDLRDEE